MRASLWSRRKHKGMASTREAGVSIKPGVKRSETPGSSTQKLLSPRSGRQRFDYKASILTIRLSAAPRALTIAKTRFLGFRCASPQALCLHPLRGLKPSLCLPAEHLGWDASSRTTAPRGSFVIGAGGNRYSGLTHRNDTSYGPSLFQVINWRKPNCCCVSA